MKVAGMMSTSSSSIQLDWDWNIHAFSRLLVDLLFILTQGQKAENFP